MIGQQGGNSWKRGCPAARETAETGGEIALHTIQTALLDVSTSVVQYSQQEGPADLQHGLQRRLLNAAAGLVDDGVWGVEKSPHPTLQVAQELARSRLWLYLAFLAFTLLPLRAARVQ